MAVLDGACGLRTHSIRNSTPLTAKDAGTRVAGPIVRAALALVTTTRIEHTEVATSIAGSAERSREVRNNASRTAFPLTNWAVTAAAPIIAATTDPGLLLISMASVVPSSASNATNGAKPRKPG